MGESLVETHALEKKMDESVEFGARLEVSVSFGRFENDELSWEKWSSFSTNKYLEEVGNLSTPGSVAQKKAYFEAHYKKIAAAKKIEESEQEKSMTFVTPFSDESCYENSFEIDNKPGSSNGERLEGKSAYDAFGLSNGERLGEENAREALPLANGEILGEEIAHEELGLPNGKRLGEEIAHEAFSLANGERLGEKCRNREFGLANRERLREEIVNKASGLANGERLREAYVNRASGLANGETLGEENTNEEFGFANGERLWEEIVPEAKEDVAFAAEEAKDELNGDLVDFEIDVREEAMLVGVETPRKDSPGIVKKTQKLENGIEQSPVLKKESLKLKARNIAQKVTPIRKERNVARTKQASTPRYSKPISIATPIASSQKKKVNDSPLPKSKNFPVRESKRGVPTSLHMSLSPAPLSSSAAVPLTRKSLIMEKMGHKDIVKRAFKSFQNRTDVSLVIEKPSPPYKPKVSSTSLTPGKGNEGLRKNVEKVAIQRRTMSKPLLSESDKSCAVKNTKAVSPSIGSRGDERSEKPKEFLKKSEAKSNAREAANCTKVKDENGKESGIKKNGTKFRIQSQAVLSSGSRKISFKKGEC